MESWQQMFLPARGGPKFLVQNLTSTPLCYHSWLVKMSSPILGLYSVDHKEDRVYPSENGCALQAAFSFE